MWQRYTERARRSIWFADEEAKRAGSEYVLTEHLLLGVVRDPTACAVRVLHRIGLTPSQIQTELGRHLPCHDDRRFASVLLAPRSKRALDLAYDEAREVLKDVHVGTEHLLLGLIREGEGLGGQVLAKLGVGLEQARGEIDASRTFPSFLAARRPSPGASS